MINYREALFQLTQIINAIRFFNGDLRPVQHLALWHYSSYYGVVLNPSLGNHQPPAPPKDHPLSNRVYVYDKAGEEIGSHHQWQYNASDITEDIALNWWGQIREYILVSPSANPRLNAMIVFYKDYIVELESKYSLKYLSSSVGTTGSAKIMIGNFPQRHCAQVVYQLILLSAGLRLKKGELNLSCFSSDQAQVYEEYAMDCINESLRDQYSVLSPPELGNPHAIIWSTHGEFVARIHYYNSHGRANGTEYTERSYMLIWKLIRGPILETDNRRVQAFCKQFAGEVAALEACYQSYLDRNEFLGVDISPEAMEEIRHLCNT